MYACEAMCLVTTPNFSKLQIKLRCVFSEFISSYQTSAVSKFPVFN